MAGHRETTVAICVRTNKEHEMPGNPREMITMAERSFPVRVRIGVPPGGLGRRLTQMTAWLDANCGSDGWAMTPSGVRGVLNDAISLYFVDPTLASAFVARWCVGSKTRSGRRRVPGARGRAGTAAWGGSASDAVTGPTQLQERSKPDPAEQASATAPK